MASNIQWPKVMKRLLSDVAIVGGGGIILLIFRFVATPFHRGFFCNDESLMHPFKDSTVTSVMLYGIGFILTIVMMAIVEGIYVRQQQDATVKQDVILYVQIKEFLRKLYSAFIPFLFGAVVEHIATDIGKYCVGRLRPHFFSVCNLDLASVNCSHGYIEDFTCTGDMNRIREVRLSFPSGHASFSAYVAVYLMMYCQKRIKLKMSPLIRPVLQMFVFSLALLTCLSRISDYKHHWSDVLGGALIGAVTAALVAAFVSDMFKDKSKLPSRSHHSSYKRTDFPEENNVEGQFHTTGDTNNRLGTITAM